MHNLSCGNEFYLRENDKSFPYPRLSTSLRFDTEARGNSEMAYEILLLVTHFAGLPRCKNLWTFFVSQPCFSGFYIVLTSLFSLFYGTCGFNRILHRPGWAHSATSYFFLEYLSSDRSSVFMFGYGWKKNWNFCRREILSNFWLFIYLQIRRTVLFMFISILCIDVHPYQYTHCFSLSPEAEFKALHWLFRLLSLTGYKGPYKWLNPRCLLDSTPTEYWSNEFF